MIKAGHDNSARENNPNKEIRTSQEENAGAKQNEKDLTTKSFSPNTQASEIQTHMDALKEILKAPDLFPNWNCIKDPNYLENKTNKHIQFLRNELGEEKLLNEILPTIQDSLLYYFKGNMLSSEYISTEKRNRFVFLGAEKLIDFVNNNFDNLTKQDLFSDRLLKNLTSVLSSFDYPLCDTRADDRSYFKDVIKLLNKNLNEEDVFYKVIMPLAHPTYFVSYTRCKNFFQGCIDERHIVDIDKNFENYCNKDIDSQNLSCHLLQGNIEEAQVLIWKDFLNDSQKLFTKETIACLQNGLYWKLRNGKIEDVIEIIDFLDRNYDYFDKALTDEKSSQDEHEGRFSKLGRIVKTRVKSFFNYSFGSDRNISKFFDKEVALRNGRQCLIKIICDGAYQFENKTYNEVVTLKEVLNRLTENFKKEDLISENFLQTARSCLIRILEDPHYYVMREEKINFSINVANKLFNIIDLITENFRKDFFSKENFIKFAQDELLGFNQHNFMPYPYFADRLFYQLKKLNNNFNKEDIFSKDAIKRFQDRLIKGFNELFAYDNYKDEHYYGGGGISGGVGIEWSDSPTKSQLISEAYEKFNGTFQVIEENFNNHKMDELFPDLIHIAQDKVSDYLKRGDISGVNKFLNRIRLANKYLFKDDSLQIIQDNLSTWLETKSIDNIKEIVRILNNNFYYYLKLDSVSEKIYQAIKESFSNSLKEGQLNDASSAIELVNDYFDNSKKEHFFSDIEGIDQDLKKLLHYWFNEDSIEYSFEKTKKIIKFIFDNSKNRDSFSDEILQKIQIIMRDSFSEFRDGDINAKHDTLTSNLYRIFKSYYKKEDLIARIEPQSLRDKVSTYLEGKE